MFCFGTLSNVRTAEKHVRVHVTRVTKQNSKANYKITNQKITKVLFESIYTNLRMWTD